MQIYDELVNGTPTFKVMEDGSETVDVRPPTSKELRAARTIAELSNNNMRLTQAYQELQNVFDQLSIQHARLQHDYQNLCKNATERKVDTEPVGLDGGLSGRPEPSSEGTT